MSVTPGFVDRLHALARQGPARIALAESADPRMLQAAIAARAAGIADLHRLIESAMRNPKVVEQPKSLTREVPEFRVAAFTFEFGHDHDGDHHIVFVESEQRSGVGQ